MLSATNDDILRIARENQEPPVGWIVVPINRSVVLRSLIGWGASALLGYGLFIILLLAIMPDFNAITLFLLGILAFLGIGSTWLAVQKSSQYFSAENYLIVLTPESFVQQNGKQIINVPMSEIEHITLRGVFGGTSQEKIDRNYQSAVISPTQMFTGRLAHRARKTPESLSFVDSRTKNIIVISEDSAFAELEILEDLLRTYVDAARNVRK